MIILDTNVISEILKRERADRRVVDWFIELPRAACRTTAVNVAEMLYGLALLPAGGRRDVLSRSLEMFVETYADRTLTFDAEAAAYYAIIAAGRRRDGRPIGVQDAMIAAIARAHGASVATRNVKDFEGTGVDVINPWKESA